MTTSFWAWLTAADSWRGPVGIPTRLQEHLSITALVLLIASAIAIPLGLWIGHSGRGRWLVALANSARAVPTLGLLFALSLWIGPHIASDLAFTIPSIVVLVLLAIPPILSGTYAGVDAVDPAARDAARGLGLTRWGVLRQVELPCALPLLLSGFRSATLQVASTATIAAAIVAVEATWRVAERNPESRSGRAHGSSTCRRTPQRVRPRPRAASRAAGSTASTPA